MTTPTIYLAGPIQHAADSGHGWRDRLIEKYDGNGFDFHNPLDNIDATEDVVIIGNHETINEVEDTYAEVEVTDETTVVSPAEIVEPDKEMIRSADALLIHYPEPVGCWGTPMEQGFVYENRGETLPADYPIIFSHGDFRPSPWAVYHADYVADDPEDGVDYLGEHFDSGVSLDG